MRIEKSNFIFSRYFKNELRCCNGHGDRCRNTKPHVYDWILLATDPSSLKYIQIESVIFLACNYFHIIYRFSRAQKQKLKNIVKFMPYIRRTDGARKTFTWDQMNKFRVSGKNILSSYNKWCYFSIHSRSFFLVPHQKISFLSLRKIFPKQQLVPKGLGNAWIMKQWDIIHLKQSKNPSAETTFLWWDCYFSFIVWLVALM